MTSGENYDGFRDLQFELSRRGLELEALSPEVAIIRGGNRAERLALAGKALPAIRAGHSDICRKAPEPRIGACVEEIRQRWPDHVRARLIRRYPDGNHSTCGADPGTMSGAYCRPPI